MARITLRRAWNPNREELLPRLELIAVADVDVHRKRMAVAENKDRHRLAQRSDADDVDEVEMILDRDVIEFQNHVAGLEFRLGSGRIGVIPLICAAIGRGRPISAAMFGPKLAIR